MGTVVKGTEMDREGEGEGKGRGRKSRLLLRSPAEM